MTERARYWATQVTAWERSGLTQAEYCRRRRIKAGSFAWWKRQLLGPARGRPTRLADRPKQSAKASKPRGRLTKSSEQAKRLTKPPDRAKRRARPAKLSAPFVELPLASAFPAPTYELVLVGGRTIRIPSQFDPQVVSRLISVVESC